jgi:hypothetical protein
MVGSGLTHFKKKEKEGEQVWWAACQPNPTRPDLAGSSTYNNNNNNNNNKGKNIQKIPKVHSKYL